MTHHFSFVLHPLNGVCIACGSRDFLELALVGETLSAEKLAAAGLLLDKGAEVFICFHCLLEFCQ